MESNKTKNLKINAITQHIYDTDTHTQSRQNKRKLPFKSDKQKIITKVNERNGTVCECLFFFVVVVVEYKTAANIYNHSKWN